MSGLPLCSMGLTELLAKIELGETTAEEVIRACFEQIEKREPDVEAWQVQRSLDEYLTLYHEQQEELAKSLLKGLPLGVKDVLDTCDFPTEMGSPIHKGRQPVDDATAVALLKRAGALVPGKTVTTEFACFNPGKTKNPVNPAHTPGGSSSGSAAAVASCMLPFALGSQTAASVIRPAAYCGVVGYVGSRGEYSLRGAQPLAQSLDSLGMFARSVADIALMRSVLLRQPAAASLSSVKPKRIAVCRGDGFGDVSVDMLGALDQVTTQLSDSGVDVVSVYNSTGVDALVGHHMTIMAWEVCRNLAFESESLDMMSPAMRGLIENGLAMDRAEYLNALAQVDVIHQQLREAHSDVDAILAPAAPGVAPLIETGTGSPHMSRPWQVLGLPTITLVGPKDEAGMPLGLQLVGKARGDDQLLETAMWVQDLISAAK